MLIRRRALADAHYVGGIPPMNFFLGRHDALPVQPMQGTAKAAVPATAQAGVLEDEPEFADDELGRAVADTKSGL